MAGITQFFDSPTALSEQLKSLAEKKQCAFNKIPQWANRILDNDGFRFSLAGFMFHRISRGHFQFSKRATQMACLKEWDHGVPGRLLSRKYADLSDEEKSFYRVFLRLSVPDAILHTLIGQFLTDKLETLLSPNCYAYRGGKGQAAAVAMVRELQQAQNKWVVRLDVKSFNETVDHAVLRGMFVDKVTPLLTDQENLLVKGAIEALFAFGILATNQFGKGMVVGSGLTPPLTNLYLSDIDIQLDSKEIPFVRYGDDIAAFCDSEEQARKILDDVTDIVTSLKQTLHPFSSAANLLDERSQYGDEERSKTDIYAPGKPFNFIGFKFAGANVCIRKQTFRKIKSRIAQFTQRSKRRIQRCIDREDFTFGCLFSGDQGETIAVASFWYVKQAVDRINGLLGYEREKMLATSRPVFRFGQGFACNVLKCVSYDDVKKQFAMLDAYAYGRLRMLASTTAISPSSLGALYDFDRTNFRKLGLRTFKDVANRYRRNGPNPHSTNNELRGG